MPATSPPAIAPATSTAPIETYQRIAALPSYDRMLTRKAAFEKREHDLAFTFRLAAQRRLAAELQVSRRATSITHRARLAFPATSQSSTKAGSCGNGFSCDTNHLNKGGIMFRTSIVCC